MAWRRWPALPATAQNIRSLPASSPRASQPVPGPATYLFHPAIGNSASRPQRNKRAEGLNLQRLPAIRGQRLQRRIAGLVVHLLAAAHPIPQIDVWEPRGAGEPHMIQDHIAAQAAPILAGMKEAVDHRQPVLQPVG